MTQHQQTKKHRFLRGILLAISGLVGLFILYISLFLLVSYTGRESITVNGIERKYRVYVPPSYNGTEPVPLLITYHMLLGSAKYIQWVSHFDQMAAQNGFIVVYPDGYQGSWAEGSGLYSADRASIDDVAFTSALLEHLTGQYSLQTDQIYLAGFSCGGMLAQRLACELPGQFAAVAAVSATLTQNVLADCNNPNHISVMLIHGEADTTVKWAGDENFSSVPATLEHWAAINQCAAEPQAQPENDPRVEYSSYEGCLNGREVKLVRVKGGEHAWPGGSKAIPFLGSGEKDNSEIDASALIWEFFQGKTR